MKQNQKKKGDCLLVQELTYGWFMPELLIATQWAGDDFIHGLLGTDVSTDEKINVLYKKLFNSDTFSQKDVFVFDSIISAFFSENPYSNLSIGDYVYKWFPRLQKLHKKLINECPDTLITGTPIVSMNLGVSGYVHAIFGDLIDKHVYDMNTILGEHYDGGIGRYVNGFFEIVTSEEVLRCELENLVYSGSCFKCGDVEIRMLPILID